MAASKRASGNDHFRCACLHGWLFQADCMLHVASSWLRQAIAFFSMLLISMGTSAAPCLELHKLTPQSVNCRCSQLLVVLLTS
jgi:hypothetical protein